MPSEISDNKKEGTAAASDTKGMMKQQTWIWTVHVQVKHTTQGYVCVILYFPEKDSEEMNY